jgi:hypothetical protein
MARKRLGMGHINAIHSHKKPFMFELINESKEFLQKQQFSNITLRIKLACRAWFAKAEH